MRRGIGFSKFVCSGNEAIISVENYIKYFGLDEKTRVIACYLEGLKYPAKFKKIVSEIQKPIIIYKAGKTKKGGIAASSHTGKIYSPIEVYKALFKQTNIIEAENTKQILNISWALSLLPPLKGRKIAIVSWGGG